LGRVPGRGRCLTLDATRRFDRTGNCSMTAPRRWFRFSLRTLFFVLTVLAVWCGYYAHWTTNRRQARGWIDAHPMKSFEAHHPGVIREFPWQLALFGESAESLIVTQARNESSESYQRQIERLRRLFPEAEIFDGTAWYEASQPPVSARR
jgi:hypothetical protein